MVIRQSLEQDTGAEPRVNPTITPSPHSTTHQLISQGSLAGLVNLTITPSHPTLGDPLELLEYQIGRRILVVNPTIIRFLLTKK